MRPPLAAEAWLGLINKKEEITKEIQEIRNLKSNFLSKYIYNIYQKVTENFSKYLRVEELILQVELQFPYLLPEKELIEFDKSKIQKDKIGFEFDYGIFFNSILSNEKCGNHLIHSMLLPKKQSIELLKKFRNEDKIDLGTALITRKNGVSTVWFNNHRFLHAEDETTIKNVCNKILYDNSVSNDERINRANGLIFIGNIFKGSKFN